MRVGGCHWPAGVTMKKALLVVLMIALLSQQTASSFVPPAAGNWLFNRTIASIMREVAKRRGISAADPRLAATEAAMSSELTALNVAATGVGAGLTMLGAPVWLTVLAGLGLVAGGSALIAYLGKEKIEIGTDGNGRLEVNTQVGERPKIVPTPYPGLVADLESANLGFQFSGAMDLGLRFYRTSECAPSQACRVFPEKEPTGAYILKDERSTGRVWIELRDADELARWIEFMLNCCYGGGAHDIRVFAEYNMSGKFHDVMVNFARDIKTYKWVPCETGHCRSEVIETRTGTKPVSNFSFTYDFHGLEHLFARENPATAKQWYDSLDKAYVGMRKDVQGAPIGNETVAKVVNDVWRRAASRPDYEGLPYSVTNPVTTADVEPWAKANPEIVPRIEDLFRPASLPQERKVVIREKIKPETSTETETETSVDPTTDPRTGSKIRPDTKTPQDPQLVKDVNVVNRPTVDIGNPVKVDLGTAPLVATPTLDEPPTAAMILDPILKMLPGFSDWKTPKYSAECPRPTFELFSKRIRMDAMCDLAEKYRPMITSIMLAVFVLIAATIVLAA